MIGVPGIAPAARLGEREGGVTGGASGRQLGAKHMQETKEGCPDAVDAVLGHLDDGPFAVAARLLGIQRVAAAGALGDGPQPDLPAGRAGNARPARHPRRGFVERQEARVRRQEAAVVRREKRRQARRGRDAHGGREPALPFRAQAWKQHRIRKRRHDAFKLSHQCLCRLPHAVDLDRRAATIKRGRPVPSRFREIRIANFCRPTCKKSSLKSAEP